MSPEEETALAERLARLIIPSLTPSAHQCEFLHRGLVTEFKKENKKAREDFKIEMIHIRDGIFEKATGKKWDDREQVRDGIGFAINARAIARKVILTIVVILVASAAAYIGLK